MEAQGMFWRSTGMWLLEHELDFTLQHSCPSCPPKPAKTQTKSPKSCNHTPLQSPTPSSIAERQDCGNPGEIPIPLVGERLGNHHVPWKGGEGCT